MNYCYFGNTTLRVSNLLYNIEAQLILFKELFEESTEEDVWSNDSELQQRYLELLIQHNLIKTNDTKTGTKNARAKSAPLEDYNLVDRKEKIITDQGEELLRLLQEQKFKYFNNFLQIDLVSLFFLKASLNFSKSSDGITDTFQKYLEVFKSFNGCLSNDIFRLLPLLANYNTPNDFIIKLKSPNFNEIDLISEILLKDEDLLLKKNRFISDIGNNNFSNPTYFSSSKGISAAIVSINLYNILLSIRNKTYDKDTFRDLYSNNINGHKNPYKKDYLSNILGSKIAINRNSFYHNYKKLISIVRKGTDSEFNEWFFYFIHSSRVLNNLQDYISLNKYYLDLTGIFEMNANEISVIKNISILLANQNYKDILNDLKTKEVSIDSLDYLFEDAEIKTELASIGVSTTIELKQFKYKENKSKLQKLLDKEFTRDNIVNKILPLFKTREDKDIQKHTTDNATVPTIFEYIIAISMYYIDNENIDFILNAGLSLDSNMLPKSHAVGGNSDFKMNYHDHTLMVEVSLTENTNQRRAEMESVSRHLGNILLDITDEESRKNTFGIFIATYLDKNVLNDFRVRRVSYWENKTKYIKGMNILPMDTDDLINVLNSNKTYQEIKPDFYELFEINNDRGSTWYSENIKPYFENLGSISNLIISN